MLDRGCVRVSVQVVLVARACLHTAANVRRLLVALVYASRCLFGKKSDRNTKRLGINKILQGVSRRIRPPLPFVVGTAV